MKVLSPLMLLLLLITKASCQEECPDVVCAEDPCEGQMCPRFYNAECRPNPCSCTPEFFFRNRNVTDRCAVRTCDTRECPERRQCIEEVRPPACPVDRPNCRQALHTRCFLPPDTDRPMSCLDMTCMEGEVCRMRERDPPFFPVVNCWTPERVSDCVPGTCNNGLQCVDDGPSVRCITPVTSTTTPSPTPDSPSPSPNTTASPSPNVTVSPSPEATTSPSPNTTTNPSPDPESSGSLSGSGGSGSLSGSGSGSGSGRCEELRCEQFLEICEEDDFGARCVQPLTCERLEPLCNAENSVCREFSGIATCLPQSSCELITCGEFERCVETRFFGVINTTIATCLPSIQGLSCEELECRPGFDVCRLAEIPDEPDTTLAQCARSTDLLPRSCDELFICTFLFNDEERICVDATQDGEAFNQICTSLNCEDTGCPFNSRCVTFTDMPFTSACDISVTSFGTTCSDRVCTGGEVCQEIVLNGTYTLGSFCGQREATPNQQRSCNDTVCLDNEVCTLVRYDTEPEIVRAECTDRESYFFNLRTYQGIFVIPTEEGSGFATGR